MTTKIVTLSVTSYDPVLVPGSTHYFGRLKHEKTDIELERPITPEESRRLYPESAGYPYETSSRFDDEPQLHAFAKSVWRQHFPGREYALSLGDALNPGLVLDGGSPALRRCGLRAHDMYRDGVVLGESEELDAVYDAWADLVAAPVQPPKRLGWWAFTESDATTRCPLCRGPAMGVPREGHELSEFWRLERTGQYLVCCMGSCEDES